MGNKPRVFIASSVEGIDAAYAIQELLEHYAECTVWDQDVFSPSSTTLRNLILKAQNTDYGIFVFSFDDTTKIRNKEELTVRDNVIFELGLFIGIIEVSNCFIVMPYSDDEIHLPTDLAGVTLLRYDSQRVDGNLKAALGPSSNQIKKAMQKISTPKKTLSHNPSQQIDTIDGVDEILKSQKIPESGFDNEGKRKQKTAGETNVLMLPRYKIHERNSIDDRLHISDGLYKKIRCIRIMNFASNLIINSDIGEIGHFPSKGIQLADGIEKIMKETKASVELILTEPNENNINDLKTKIANHRAGSSRGALYSALATLYKNLTTDTVYAQRSKTTPIMFDFYVMKTSMPFGIFNVEFLNEASEYNHVKVDLYSAALDDEDDRRSFIIWQADDPENYYFFVHNFNSVKNNPILCEKATLEMLKVWAAKWENLKPGGSN